MRYRSLLISTLALLALAAPAVAEAAAPRAVVYSKATTVGGEVEGGLFAVKSGHLNQLTGNPTDSEPDFSSDGRMIAFARAGDIWVMRADGSGQRALTSGPELDGRPLFAPNGRYLLFERRAEEGGNRDLNTVRVSGSTPRRLVYYLADEAEATFSPSGRWIAFVIPGGTGAGATDEVYRVRPSGDRLGGVSHTGPVDEFAPRFLARGIVFSRGQSGDGPGAYADVYTAFADGRRPRPLIRGAGSAYVEDVSPNGRTLLFRRAQGLWVKQLPVGRRRGRRARKLAQLPDNSRTNGVFSANGRKIAAFVAADERQSLVAIDVATRRQTGLAAGYEASEASGTVIGPVIAWQPAR
ncbi:MAG TPA: hypothetical protein VKU40_10345 [Thermoanaerobaculia bacterium]|nr:hypothetical protein [Thermoanaerobaculia bacterium]